MTLVFVTLSSMSSLWTSTSAARAVCQLVTLALVRKYCTALAAKTRSPLSNVIGRPWPVIVFLSLSKALVSFRPTPKMSINKDFSKEPTLQSPMRVSDSCQAPAAAGQAGHEALRLQGGSLCGCTRETFVGSIDYTMGPCHCKTVPSGCCGSSACSRLPW